MRSVLDPACGDSNTAIMLAAMGKKVAALHRDPARASKIRFKAILAGSHLEVKCGDMRDISRIYKQRCNLVTCLSDSLSRLLNEADLYGTLAQLFLILEPEGILVIKTFDYDRLYRENLSALNDFDGFYRGLQVKVSFRRGNGTKSAGFILQMSETAGPGSSSDREELYIPTRPVFQKDLLLQLAELGFEKIETYRPSAAKGSAADKWSALTVAFRPSL